MLKIDGQFVRGLGHHDDGVAIVALTIQLARALNLATTAEGVETTGQRDRLRAWAAATHRVTCSDDPARPMP